MNNGKSEFVPVWPRPFRAAPGAPADLFFACFSVGPLIEDGPANAAALGAPSDEALEALEVAIQTRESDPHWFERWRSGNARAVAAQHLGPHANRLDEVDHAVLVRARLEDPTDLGYLQAAWALARWYSRRGAQVVLDGRAGRFLPGEALQQLPHDAPFDVRREVLLVMDPAPRAPDDEHWFHTRGLAKAGRPDIVAAAMPDDGQLIAQLFLGLADMLFRGAVPLQPRHEIQIAEHMKLFLRPLDEGLTPLLGLDNPALQLVDEEDNSLGGLSAWLRKHALPQSAPSA